MPVTLSEKRIIAACLAMSLAGILLLIALSLALKPPETSVEAAGSESGKVRIGGVVVSQSNKGDYYSLTIAGYKTLDAISFEPGKIESLHLKNLQQVELTGKINRFKGKSSIIIEKIRPINSSLLCR